MFGRHYSDMGSISRWRIVSARGLVLAIVAMQGLGAAAAQTPSDDPAARQFLTSCGVCHAVAASAGPRQGPNLAGIVGRPAAKIDGFKYSPALSSSGLVWDEATLDRWLEDAQAVVPGSIMPYRQRDADKRRLIIAYLKTVSP